MRWVCLFILTAAIAASVRGAGASDDAGMQFFESRIRPVLVENCYSCHSATAKKLKGGLYLDSRAGIVKGGDDGPAIVGADPAKSKLIEAISWSNVDLQMPPKKKLAEQQIADIAAWIKMGAPWPATDAPAPVAAVKVFDLEKRRASHWCWEKIRRPELPQVKDSKWSQSPIDRFILAKLESQGLQPAPAADRAILIRRAYFDVIGLPPPPEDVQAFVADRSPDAFAKVVDRLLASDHFGERWARHWMDLVRYGETRGHEFDPLIPNAWQYRDYLIRAFNADVPYNQFVVEHMAGDLLEHPRLNPEQHFNESILGTGFWFLDEEVHSPVDIRQDEADRMNNRVDTMTKAFLGLTVGCARCHDHKFDAIGTKDFYALNGFLISSAYRQVPFKSMEINRKVAERMESVRAKMGPDLLKSVLSTESAGLGMADDLLAARWEILGGEGGAKVSKIVDTDTNVPAAPSAARRLWARELTKAKSDESHPLHLFALAAFDATADQPGGFAPFRSKLLDSIRVCRQKVAGSAAPDQVILDFNAQNPPAAWYSDGVAFGLGPVHAGEVLLGSTVEHPVLGIARWGMARRDPFFRDFKPAPGTETDTGALGGWHRSGQTIRTPKVTLKTGHLWYLVRGAGRAYGCVDSHLMINGPLHGALLTQWKSERNAKWAWIRHDLSAYAGQRCEVEFSPLGDGAFEVAKVVEADQPPPIETPNALLMSAISDAPFDSVEALASVYQKIFADVAHRLSVGNIVGSTDVRDIAALADFYLSNQKLFDLDAHLEAANQRTLVDADPSPVSEAVKLYVTTQAQNAAEIVYGSPTAPAMFEGNGVDENVLIRGVAKNTGDVVPRRFLQAIAGENQPPYPTTGSGRMQLAAAMLDKDNPFTSRVMVNRVWQHLFGRGIVATVDNFGVLGQAPTHRELLDYLADNFRTEQAWSIKRLIRSIMLSSAYQMSSKPSEMAEKADPLNLTFNHMPVRRLEAEAIRDEILSVSGRLDPTLGGAPIEVNLTGFMDGRGRPGSGPLDGAGRRSIYTRVRRNFLSPMMMAFDAPIPFACVGRRNVSNVPAQALILMNDPFVLQQAELWAKNVLAAPGLSAEERIKRMYMKSLGRDPRASELGDAMKFLQEQGDSYGLKADDRLRDPRVWTDLCHVMFNLKEFIFIE